LGIHPDNPLRVPQPPHVDHIPAREKKPEMGEGVPLHIIKDERPPPPGHEPTRPEPPADRLPPGSWEINDGDDNDDPFRVS
jgi:hypothetical protein